MPQKSNLMLALSLLLTALLILSGCSGSKVVAEVNGETIKRAELETHQNILLFVMPELAEMLSEAEDRQALEETVLNALIENKLLAQFAAKKGIVLTDDELTVALEQQKETFSASSGLNDFTQLRQEYNITDDQLKDFLAGSLYLNKLIVKLSTELKKTEIDAFQAEQPTAGVMLAVSQILVPTANEAELVRARLLAGEELETVAAEFAPAAKQGYLGYISAETLAYPAPFLRAVNQLSKGEVSAPVQTGEGWHIIELHERKLPTTEELAVLLAGERLVTSFNDYYQRAEIKRR